MCYRRCGDHRRDTWTERFDVAISLARILTEVSINKLKEYGGTDITGKDPYLALL